MEEFLNGSNDSSDNKREKEEETIGTENRTVGGYE